MVPWAQLSPQPKRQLNRFSRFAGLTSVTDRPTDRQTDHAPRSVTIAMRPTNNNNKYCWGNNNNSNNNTFIFLHIQQHMKIFAKIPTACNMVNYSHNIIATVITVNCKYQVPETEVFWDSWSESVTGGGFKCSGNASIACCQQTHQLLSRQQPSKRVQRLTHFYL